MARAHNLNQGQGYATVIDQRNTASYVLNRKDRLERQRLADEAKRRKASQAAFKDYDPEYFYAHDKELSAKVDNVVNKGKMLMNSGIDNPWTSTDPRAQSFQREAKETQRIAETSIQMKEHFVKQKAIYDNPEKRAKIKNWQEVMDFYHNTSPSDVIKNGTPFPSVQFKNPGFDTVGEFNKVVKDWQAVNKGKVMSSADADQIAKEIVANPAYQEEGSLLGAMGQQLAELGSEDKKKYKNRAEKNGTDPLFEFTKHKVMDYSGTRINLAEEMANSARKIKMSEYEKEEGGRRKSGTYLENEEEVVAAAVTSKLSEYSGQVERDVSEGLYGDPDGSIKENMDAAKEYYSKIFKNALHKKHKDVKVGSGDGSEEFEMSENKWYEDLKSANSLVSGHAANFLVGSEDLFEKTKVLGASVIKSEDIAGSVLFEGVGPALEKGEPYLIVDIKEEEGGKRKKAKGLKETKLSEKEKTKLAKDTGYNNPRVFRLTPENRHIFEKRYRNAYKAQGKHYVNKLQDGTDDPLGIYKQ